MEDYIVLANIPKIQLDSEEELRVLRKRNQSPSPCRDQKLRTYRLVLKNKDEQCVTYASHCSQIKPRYSGYERCLLALEMSFGYSICKTNLSVIRITQNGRNKKL